MSLRDEFYAGLKEKKRGCPIKLTSVIKIWDQLHARDTGEIGFCDLEKALDNTVGVVNDINSCQP